MRVLREILGAAVDDAIADLGLHINESFCRQNLDIDSKSPRFSKNITIQIVFYHEND